MEISLKAAHVKRVGIINCKEKNICTFEGNCLVKNDVFMAKEKTQANTSSYLDMSDNNFRTSYYDHLRSFKNRAYTNETELFKYLRKLKEREVERTITWENLRRSSSCPRRSGLCNLWPDENVEMLLNQATPFTQLKWRFDASTCCHVSYNRSYIGVNKCRTQPSSAPV